MADKTAIEWTDRTWNPVSGCTRASAGCDNCYAVTMTKRLEAMGQEKYSGLVNIGKGHFNGAVKCHEDALLLPLKWRKPQRVFVNSMSDLFHKEVPFEFIDKVFAVMALCPHLTFQILTKRPERAAEYFSKVKTGFDEPGYGGATAILDAAESVAPRSVLQRQGLLIFNGGRYIAIARWPLPNVWIGTSVEDQKTADERIPHLLAIPAAVRFLSCEPLLGPVNLGGSLDADRDNPCGCGDGECHECWRSPSAPAVHWVICGGESGPHARPMHPDWARSLRDQCQAAGVPFLFKQWGEWAPGVDPSPCLHSGWVRATADAKYTHPSGFSKSSKTLAEEGFAFMERVGKKAAGRLLDGRTWDQFPEVTA